MKPMSMLQQVPLKMVAKFECWFLLVMGLLRASSFFSYAIVALAILGAQFRKKEYMFLILMIVCGLNTVNNAFFQKDVHYFAANRIALFVVAAIMTIQNMGRGTRSAAIRAVMRPFLLLAIYVVYMMCVSTLGWMPIISILKAILFLVFLAAFVQGVGVLAKGKTDLRIIRAAILAVATFYLVGSVLLIPFPQFSRNMMADYFMATGRDLDYSLPVFLFNGITWHSQTLGPLCALLNALVLSDLLFNLKKRSAYYWTLLGCVPILVYMSASRTGMFAYVFSLIVCILFYVSSKNVSQGRKGRLLTYTMLVVFILMGALALSPSGFGGIERFLRKGEAEIGEMTLADSVLNSRMGLIEQGWDNFKESPWIGNGFQVNKETAERDYSRFVSYLSAPVEKGVLPIMILEEGGAIGAAIFLIFIVYLFVTYRKYEMNCFLSVFTTLIFLNSGEAIFFATSATGGVAWLLCFSALLLDIDRMRLNESEQREAMAMAGPHQPPIRRAF